jgi:hypothetical protein
VPGRAEFACPAAVEVVLDANHVEDLSGHEVDQLLHRQRTRVERRARVVQCEEVLQRRAGERGSRGTSTSGRRSLSAPLRAIKELSSLLKIN